MTEAEEHDLHELSSDLSKALQSPWQPRTVARAFATRDDSELTLTMQGWIDLDLAQSPLLHGGRPETEEQLARAFSVFDVPLAQTTGAAAALIVEAMREEIREAFAASLPMRPENATEGEDDGFGEWAPIFACLVSQCGMAPVIALRMPVAQVFVLIAAHRGNQGWKVAGTPYAVRDVEDIDPQISPMDADAENSDLRESAQSADETGGQD